MDWLRRRDRWEFVTWVMLAIAAVAVCITFRDYGVSWDEEFSHTQGVDFLKWYSSGFTDQSVMRAANSEYVYGGFFNSIAALLAARSIFGTYETIHLAIAAVGVLGLFVTYLTGKALAGPRAGSIAALVLAVTPTYYGHSFINPKDLPFAVFYLLAVYALIRLYDKLPRPGLSGVLKAGAAIGLALGIRVGGVMLLGYAGVLIAVWHLYQFDGNRANWKVKTIRDVKLTAPTVVGIWVVAWLVMLVWWPFAQLDPIRNPLFGIHKSTSYTDANWTNLFRGSYIQTSELPRTYLLVMLLVTLPEFYPVGIALCMAGVLVSAQRARIANSAQAGSTAKLFFFLFVAVFPIAAAAILKPIVYDGTRLFLFVIPPLAVLAGIGISWLFSLAIKRVAKILFASAVLCVVCLTVYDMIRTHPYEYVYFNRTSGGLRRAYGRFETEYWGTSYKEGMEWLGENYERAASPRSIRIANTSNPFLTGYYIYSDRPDMRRFVQVGLDENPDVILSITRWNQHLDYPGAVVHVVSRMGTPLLYIIKVASRPATEKSLMSSGLDLLYSQKNPAAAAIEFRKILEINPNHYGATFQLAIALDQLNQREESTRLWSRVLQMATGYKDTATARTAREKLLSSRR